MESDDSILGKLDAENLQNQGLLRPGHSGGSIRIHKRRLNHSSDQEYRAISLEIPPNSPNLATAFPTIPLALISRDTLAYLGLSVEKANQVWSEWTHWPTTGPRREIDSDDGGLQVTFFDFITARLDNHEDAYDDDDTQWHQCLTVCGMASSVQNAIMDVNFKNIRLTNSCIFWIKDTIAMRYAGLEDIRRASHQREMELVRAATWPGGSGGSLQQAGSTRDGASSMRRETIRLLVR